MVTTYNTLYRINFEDNPERELAVIRAVRNLQTDLGDGNSPHARITGVDVSGGDGRDWSVEFTVDVDGELQALIDDPEQVFDTAEVVEEGVTT